ncbi:YitT family protein, partial [Bacillus pumilus]
VLNIQIFFIAWKMLGRTMFTYTIVGTVSSSFFLAIFQPYQIQNPPQHALALSVLFACVFIGTVLGKNFKF